MKTYTEADMTPWFFFPREKPVHPGVFMVMAHHPRALHRRILYSRWAHGYWCTCCSDAASAANCNAPTDWRVTAWRGLTAAALAPINGKIQRSDWPFPVERTSENLIAHAVHLLQQAIRMARSRP